MLVGRVEAGLGGNPALAGLAEEVRSVLNACRRDMADY